MPGLSQLSPCHPPPNLRHQVLSQSQPQSPFLYPEKRRRPPSSLTPHQRSPSSVCRVKGTDRLQVWPWPALLRHYHCVLPCPAPLTPTLHPRLFVRWAATLQAHCHICEVGRGNIISISMKCPQRGATWPQRMLGAGALLRLSERMGVPACGSLQTDGLQISEEGRGLLSPGP